LHDVLSIEHAAEQSSRILVGCKSMSVRGLTPIFKWGFGLRPSKFLVPLMGNNILVSGEEAVANQPSQPDFSLEIYEDFKNSFSLFYPPVSSPSSSENAEKSALSASFDTAQNGRNIVDRCDSLCDGVERLLDRVSEHLFTLKDKSNNSPRINEKIRSSPLSTSSACTTSVTQPIQAVRELSSNQISSIKKEKEIIENSMPSVCSNCSSSSASSSSSVKSYVEMTDEAILELLESDQLYPHRLEEILHDCTRAVLIRRKFLERQLSSRDSTSTEKISNRGDLSFSLKELPFDSFDYDAIFGACCENVIGYVTVPVGVAGPLLLDNELVHIPMATTEGCLVASTHRGCKAITQSGGAVSSIVDIGMTRAPIVRFENVQRATELRKWIENNENFQKICSIFNKTSRYAQLTNVKACLAGRYVYLRFKSKTGDAMGMNIVGKGVERVLEYLMEVFPDMVILSLSGNYCTDKKPSAINWIEGRGRSVICEASIKKEHVQSILKTSVDVLVELNIAKNFVGSALAGSVGGFNAHASNIVTAVFLATGQDVAQNVESSNCITLMEKLPNGDLCISVTMPSIEVGTVGGGTALVAQAACLDIMHLKQSTSISSSSGQIAGSYADRLARIVCGAVLAGELSLMSALSAGDLMKSHLKLNRKQK